jgi:hypothetical protein
MGRDRESSQYYEELKEYPSASQGSSVSGILVSDQVMFLERLLLSKHSEVNTTQ